MEITIFTEIIILICCIPILICTDNCLDKPDVGVRTCTSQRLNSYNDRTETERKLWTKDSVTTAMRCSSLCMDDKSCVSYFYNKDSKKCTGHSIMFGNATAAPEEIGNKFYYINGVEGYIGDLCHTDNDCIVTSSECRADCVNSTQSGTSQCSEKRCWCKSGYSFSPTQHTCLAVCTVYGNNFMRTYLHMLDYGTPADYNGITLDDCKQHCLQATDTVCRSLQYGATSYNCFLSNQTRLDAPEHLWIYDSYYYQFSYYQRDCL